MSYLVTSAPKTVSNVGERVWECTQDQAVTHSAYVLSFRGETHHSPHIRFGQAQKTKKKNKSHANGTAMTFKTTVWEPVLCNKFLFQENPLRQLLLFSCAVSIWGKAVSTFQVSFKATTLTTTAVFKGARVGK